ncbi:MAG: hypothetical protein QUV05_11790 [Phycisphaerae bacterium]|jgi:hypothetical protein|nr:hypothetical protein [Phycisphaerae bacterium]
MTSVPQSQQEKVVELVRRYLDRHQPKDYRLEVVPDGVQQEDDWYYVVIRPEPENAGSYEYYGYLTEAEQELQEKENVKVLLVPALPG